MSDFSDREVLTQLKHALNLTSGLAAQFPPSVTAKLQGPLLAVRQKLRGMRLTWHAASRELDNRIPALALKRQDDARVIFEASERILDVLKALDLRSVSISPAALQATEKIWLALQDALPTLAGPVGSTSDVLERLKYEIMTARVGSLGQIADGFLSIRPLDEFETIRYDEGVEQKELLTKWADRIADRWKIYGFVLKRGLLVRAKELGLSLKDVKREAVAGGLQEALRQVDHLYRVRLDRKWIKRHHIAGEPVANLRPSEELLPEEYWRWIENQAIKNAVARLECEGEVASSRRAPSLPMSAASSAPSPSLDNDPLGALVASEAAERAVQGLAQIEGSVTPGQKRVLDALRAALQHTSNWAKARKLAAENLRISPATLRVHLHKIRRNA